MIVLDTNVLSEMMKASPSADVARWLAAQPATSLYTTAVTQAEILHGVMLLPAGRRRGAIEKAAEAMFDEDFAGRVLPFGSDAARLYARIAADRRRAGRPIAQERSASPVCGSFRYDISPAKPKSAPSARRMKCGCFARLISPVAGSTRSTACHSYQPSAGMRQRARLHASRHIGFPAASSARAMKLVFGGFASFHQCGTRPQRPAASSSSPEFEGRRRNAIVSVGKTLKRGAKGFGLLCRPMCQKRAIAFSSGLAKRPHIR